MNLLNKEVIEKFDDILSRGLCKGLGSPDGQMCVEAAITQALGFPFNDEPNCVEPEIRSFKIALNDYNWSSPEARSKGLRDLGIAQIGSKGVVDGNEFAKLLSTKTIKVLIPTLFRDVFNKNDHPKCIEAASRCALEGTATAAYYAANAAYYAAYYAANAAYYAAANNANYAAYYAANAANDAANAANDAYYVANAVADKYLLLSASLALEVLKELKSPGCEWL